MLNGLACLDVCFKSVLAKGCEHASRSLLSVVRMLMRKYLLQISITLAMQRQSLQSMHDHLMNKCKFYSSTELSLEMYLNLKIIKLGQSELVK